MRIKKKDHSGRPHTKMPPTPELDLILYHWSPTSNRPSIKKLGLDVGRKTLQSDWRPPYVCFSDDPMLAWTLSGRMWPEIEEWDLWMVHMPSQTSFEFYEIILDTSLVTKKYFIKEYRIYSRIYKRDLMYVGTRTQE